MPFPTLPDPVFKWRTNMPHARHVDPGRGDQNFIPNYLLKRGEFRPMKSPVCVSSFQRVVPLLHDQSSKSTASGTDKLIAVVMTSSMTPAHICSSAEGCFNPYRVVNAGDYPGVQASSADFAR